jgi:hypothetical protein
MKVLYNGERELALAGSIFYIYKEPLILVLIFFYKNHEISGEGSNKNLKYLRTSG